MNWLQILGLVPWQNPTMNKAIERSQKMPVFQWQRSLPVKKTVAIAEYSSPIIWKNWILIGSSTENDLLALDRFTGALDYRFPTDASVQSSPVLDNQKVYFADTAGKVFCYDLSSRRKVWSRDAGAPVLSAVYLDGNQLFLSTVDDVVYALSLDNGDLVWRYRHKVDPSRKGKLTIFGSPTPTVTDTEVLAGFSDGSIAALDKKTGEQKRIKWLGEGRYPDIIASITHHKDAVIATGFEKPLIALKPDFSAQLWSTDVGGSASMTVHKDVVYHSGGDGILRAYGLQSGDIIWSWDSKTESVLTQARITKYGLLLGAASGTIYLIHPKTGKERWSYVTNHGLSGMMNTPIIKNGQISALTNAGNLLSFQIPTKDTKKKLEIGCQTMFCQWEND